MLVVGLPALLASPIMTVALDAVITLVMVAEVVGL